MEAPLDIFRDLFLRFSGNAPFPWQERLFALFYRGDFPPSLTLPTGTGKTSVLLIWTLTWALRARFKVPGWFPRRLVYVVNRRTVVDQATVEAENILTTLVPPNGTSPSLDVVGVRGDLATVSSWGGAPLGVSTMRGQRDLSDDWWLDPSRPSIVVGTVDMVGSALLGMGYRRGYKTRPIAQGFLGHDSLLVLDEAHLEPAFEKLLRELPMGDRFRVLYLSATLRSPTSDGMTLEIADLANPVIKSRVGTRKSLTMVKVPTRKDIQRKVLEIASGLKGSGVPVLVYLNNVDAVSFVQGGLEKEVPKSVQVLTGTKRGLERDKMLGSCPIFARFLANTPQGVTPTPGTVYMVCTSAGEVGVNFSGLHMVMDTVSYERMVQRFGRLDRFGVGGGTVTVIYPENGDASMLPGWDKTVALLEKLPKGPDDTRDVCPSSLDKLPPAECLAAFSPVPAMRTLTRELLDMWSMSTFKQFPGRPPVDPYLHGVEEYDGGRVTVAWRNEVRLFTPEVLAKLNLDGFLDSYPLHPQEKLSDLSRRVFSELKVLAGKYGKAPVWKVSDGAVEVATLSDLVAGKPWDLDGLTIVLPTDIGGLSSNGTLDGSAPQDVALTYDVSDCGGKRGFVQGDLPSGVRQVALFNPNLVGVPGSPMWRWWVSPNEKKVSPGGEMLLQDHLDAARGASLELVSHLDLSPVESRAVVYASALHDVGKDRAVWQVGMGNSSYPQKVVAKSGNHNLPPQHHYRHELGSVVDILARQDFGSEKPEVRDLVLHLVAVHHGRGRPGFPDVEQWVQGSPDDLVRSVILDIARRFDRLTEQYGRCQLAYLESLLRAVDVHTS